MSFFSFFGGFKVSLQQMAKTRVTWQYPLEKKPKPNRQHGRHVLNRYEDGMEKCIGCELCAGVCPADCIYVRGADNPAGDPVSPGERYGFVYEINYLRCIHCDMCVEACPTEAITETKLFEFSFTNRADAIYTKKELLVGDDGRPKHMPWEDWRQGDDLFTSAWMRATSPSGNAAYEGRVQWSGELGYGIRAPEGGQSGLRDDAATGIKEIRDVFSDHLDDWERNDDQRGPVGVRNRLKAHIALRKASIKIPGSEAQAAGGGAVIHALPVLATATLVDRITFGIGATIIILGAIGVVTSRNPVHSALMLVMTLFGVAVLFVEEGANFLAAVQVIVYAGAIVVLFLFVIMFLGVDREENLADEPLPLQRPLAIALVVLGLAGLLILAIGSHWSTGAPSVAGAAQGQKGGDVAAIGRSVFTTYLFPFEITAALLVIAVVGAVVLARRPTQPSVADESGDDGDGDDGDEDEDEDEGTIDSTEAMATAVAETVSAARSRAEGDRGGTGEEAGA